MVLKGLMVFSIRCLFVFSGFLCANLVLCADPTVTRKSNSDYIFGSEIEFGGFWPTLNTEIRLDSSDGEIGIGVEFEDDLDFADRKFLPLILGSWRISESWLVQIDYVILDRKSTATIQKEIEWPPGEGGEVFPVGARVASFLDFGSSRVAGAYIFRTSKKSELGVSLGLHLTSMASGLALAVQAGDQVEAIATDMELPLIPLPTFGIFWGIRISENWKVRLRADYFALTYDDYSGSLISARADGSYQFSKHWAVGAGVNYYDLSVEAKKKEFTGKAEFGYWGPSIFVRYIF